MFIPDPGSGFISIPFPESKGQKSTGSQIPYPQHWPQSRSFSLRIQILLRGQSFRYKKITKKSKKHLSYYEPMIYTANPLRGQVGGGWALEIKTFLGSVKWHRAVRRVPLWPTQCSKFFLPPCPQPPTQYSKNK